MKTKDILKYSFYILPGYGIYREFKKPKENRRIHTFLGWSIYSSGALLKLILIPAYISLGISTGNWNPLRPSDLYKTTIKGIEKTFSKKENNLEKKFYLESPTINTKKDTNNSEKSKK